MSSFRYTFIPNQPSNTQYDMKLYDERSLPVNRLPFANGNPDWVQVSEWSRSKVENDIHGGIAFRKIDEPFGEPVFFLKKIGIWWTFKGVRTQRIFNMIELVKGYSPYSQKNEGGSLFFMNIISGKSCRVTFQPRLHPLIVSTVNTIPFKMSITEMHFILAVRQSKGQPIKQLTTLTTLTPQEKEIILNYRKNNLAAAQHKMQEAVEKVREMENI